LSKVFCTDANLSCEQLLSQDFIRVESILSEGIKYKNRKIKRLSLRELAVAIRYYRGETVKNFSQTLGLPAKSVYVYRRNGVAKLTALKQWLNNERAKQSFK
jgi:DNA-binding NarL/FixJ family response regulator